MLFLAVLGQCQGLPASFQALQWVAPAHLEREGLSSSMVKVAKLAGVFEAGVKTSKRLLAEANAEGSDDE